MLDRLVGLETEFAIRYSPQHRDGHTVPGRPTNDIICRAIMDGITRLVRAAPGERDHPLGLQQFVQNGGAFSYENSLRAPGGGPVESSTPECRGPKQLLVYQRAQEALLCRALAHARERLATDGWRGDIAVLKNCCDAKGHLYGTHENYDADVASGLSLLVYRVGVVVLLALAAVTSFVVFGVLLAVFLGVLVMLLLFPLSRHWLGLDSYSCSGVKDGWSPRAERACERFAMWVAHFSFIPVSFLGALLLRCTAFRKIRSSVTAFIVSRQVITGTGALKADGTFALSQRTDAVRRIMRCSASRDTAVFETGNLLKNFLAPVDRRLRQLPFLFSRRQRLHLGCLDSNCAQTAEYLKIGSTALVLDMVEAGFLEDAPQVQDALDSLGQIASDPTLRCRVPLKGGEAWTALQIQQWYVQRARAFLDSRRVTPMEGWEIVRLWEDTLTRLRSDRSSLVGRIDWVTKLTLLDGAGLHLCTAARKKIDLKYHELGNGYFSQLERAGLAPVLVAPEEVEAAVLAAPPTTPAWLRGQAIRRGAAPGRQLIVSWNGVRDDAQAKKHV